jgi:uncharacterized protein YgiM (DUF1202 family)
MKSQTITKLIATAFAAVALVAAGSPALASAPDAPAAVRGTPVTRIRALVDLNIRSGPGTEFRRVGKLWPGDHATVTGMSDHLGWWRIRCPWGGTCWVSANPRYAKPVAWRR